MPRPRRKVEIHEDRFWRRERLTHKFDVVTKGTFVARSGKLRPAKSEKYLVNVAERFQERITRKLSVLYYNWGELERKIDALIAEEQNRSIDPNKPYHEVVTGSIRQRALELQRNLAERRYLELVQQEMKKGNIPWRHKIAELISKLDKQRQIIKEDIAVSNANLRDATQEVFKEYEKVRKQLKKDPEYRKLREIARFLRINYRKIISKLKTSGARDYEFYRLGILKPEELDKKVMLAGYHLTQQSINCEEADIKVLEKYLSFLGKKTEFEPLKRTILSIRTRKQQGTEQMRQYLKENEKWWFGKSGQ